VIRSRFAHAVVIAIAAGLVATTSGEARAAAPPPIRGIDVSMWQGGSVRWSSVAASSIRFAFVKASQGAAFVDPDYARNAAGARAAGIVVGAYDYGSPSGSTTTGITHSATVEAEHFLAVAQPQPVDLRPAMDIETTGGLSPAQLRLWLTTWVNVVRGRLHVKPFIYTSPYFWQTRVGNTSTLSGLATLWIAHWTTASSPLVPANDWGNLGWGVWQWSDCQHVSGIPGCVDADRAAGANLLPYRIGSIPAAATAPAVAGAPAVGYTIRSTAGTWTGTAPIATRLVWQRCDATGHSCQTIPGQSGLAYTPAAADYRHTLRIAVAARNRLGTTIATSAVTASVADRTPPTVPVVDAPTHGFQSGTSFTGAWHSTDTLSGVASYDVIVRRSPSAGAEGVWQPLATATAQSTLPLTAAPGVTTCLRARAHDAAGNTSGWSQTRCATVPIHPSSFGRIGHWWVNSTTGAVSTLSAGASLYRRNLVADDIGVFARTCPTCGSISIVWNGRVLRTASLARATAGETLIVVLVGGTAQTGNLTVVSTLARRPVVLDGISVLRLG
jgi:GH25 family lysozyme M1 (1,4-beta-N-acetylmuramidase)